MKAPESGFLMLMGSKAKYAGANLQLLYYCPLLLLIVDRLLNKLLFAFIWPVLQPVEEGHQ